VQELRDVNGEHIARCNGGNSAMVALCLIHPQIHDKYRTGRWHCRQDLMIQAIKFFLEKVAREKEGLNGACSRL